MALSPHAIGIGNLHKLKIIGATVIAISIGERATNAIAAGALQTIPSIDALSVQPIQDRISISDISRSEEGPTIRSAPDDENDSWNSTDEYRYETDYERAKDLVVDQAADKFFYDPIEKGVGELTTGEYANTWFGDVFETSMKFAMNSLDSLWDLPVENILEQLGLSSVDVLMLPAQVFLDSSSTAGPEQDMYCWWCQHEANLGLGYSDGDGNNLVGQTPFLSPPPPPPPTSEPDDPDDDCDDTDACYCDYFPDDPECGGDDSGGPDDFDDDDDDNQ